jgi:hypothetical protein
LSNLAPGDLAEIIRSLDGHCTGKIIECVRIEYIDHPEYGTIWLVQSPSDDLVTEYGGVGNNVHVPASWLRKIPKDKTKDKTKDVVLESEGHEVLT